VRIASTAEADPTITPLGDAPYRKRPAIGDTLDRMRPMNEDTPSR
jgi:hypothetical protein